MKLLVLILLGLLVAVQAALWTRPNGIQDLIGLHGDIDATRLDVASLTTKNKVLAAEVLDLRTGTEALEERARSDLGMIRASETFFQVIESPSHASTAAISPTGAESRTVDLSAPDVHEQPNFDRPDAN